MCKKRIRLDWLLLWHGLEHFAHVCFPSEFEDDHSIRIDPRQFVDRTDESQPHYTFLFFVLLLQLALVELESTEIRIRLRGAEEGHPGSHPKRESYYLHLRWLVHQQCMSPHGNQVNDICECVKNPEMQL